MKLKEATTKTHSALVSDSNEEEFVVKIRASDVKKSKWQGGSSIVADNVVFQFPKGFEVLQVR